MTDCGVQAFHSELDILTAEERRRLQRDFAVSIMINLAFCLFASALAIFLFIDFISSIFQSLQDVSLITLAAIALFGGTLCSVAIFLPAIKESVALNSDCSSGKCEIITLRPKRAFRFEAMETTPGIALDCGDSTVFLIGGWWNKESGRGDIIWSSSSTSKAIAYEKIRIRRLIRSRRVLSVETEGKPLRIPDGILSHPHTEFDFPGFGDCFHVQSSCAAIFPEQSRD